MKELDEILAKRNKAKRVQEEKVGDEKSTLHSKSILQLIPILVCARRLWQFTIPYFYFLSAFSYPINVWTTFDEIMLIGFHLC